MHDTQSAALPPMTGGTHVCLYVVLLINKFHYWLERGKKKTFVVKTSIMYNRNDSVMKNLAIYVKDK